MRKAERGRASLRLELEGGEVKILHGFDNVVIHRYPKVAEGTWDEMVAAILAALGKGMAEYQNS